MVNNPVLEKQKEAVPLSLVSMICIAVILACALLTGFIPQMILSFIVLAMCFVLMLMGDIYLAFPVMLFYNAHFGLVLGIAVYRCFSFLLLAGIFLKFKSIKIIHKYSHAKTKKSHKMWPLVSQLLSTLCSAAGEHLATVSGGHSL